MDSSAERVGEVTTCYYGHTSYRDLYFFGHGHGKSVLVCGLPVWCTLFLSLDYRAALREFTLVTALSHPPPVQPHGIPLLSLTPSLPPSPSHWSVQVSGKIPIPPRYAFGIFYSRYWAYNDIGDRVCTCTCICH